MFRNFKTTVSERLCKAVYFMTDAEQIITDGFELREKCPLSGSENEPA